MRLKNGEFRQQNIRQQSIRQKYLRQKNLRQKNLRQKDRGQVEWVTGLFFLLMLGILMCTWVQLASWRATADYLEDALAASNLASALIDVEEYGKTHKVCIRDASAAFSVYREAVRENLQLDEAWECSNQGLISGPVEIVDYVIYNVDGNQVEAVRVVGSGQPAERWCGERGNLRTPNGVPVEYTGVYSEICFSVEGFLGVTVEARKGKFVDIVAGEG